MERFGTVEVVQIALTGAYCIALWLYLARSA